MVRVRFVSSAQRNPEEIVDQNMKVRDFLETQGASMSSVFTINGAAITTHLDKTFKELMEAGVASDTGVISIYETIKTSNAVC